MKVEMKRGQPDKKSCIYEDIKHITNYRTFSKTFGEFNTIDCGSFSTLPKCGAQYADEPEECYSEEDPLCCFEPGRNVGFCKKYPSEEFAEKVVSFLKKNIKCNFFDKKYFSLLQ
jgi:hypothetical protein